MVHEPIFLDLSSSSSSSDEDDEDHIRNRNGSTALLYIAEVFHIDMDEDDVRIIDEPPSNGTVRRQKKPRVGRAKLDDDDCCILDTDPGAAADAASDVLSPLNSDELVMTGEKGPVACRDFPHARYLCVHFPFKSTLHSKFCAQCHCYVCDSLAPCSLWGEGNNPNDHCHASEEPRWKSLRKIAKYGSVTSFAVPSTGAAAAAAGESRHVQTARIQTFPSCTPPSITLVPHPSVNSTGGGGVLPRVATTVKRDPLVIQLKGKGRGKASQQHQHLAMQNARQLGVRRKIPLPISAPRPTRPPPSGRAAAADKSSVITPNPNSSLRSGGATTTPPAPNPIPRNGRPTVPSTATPPAPNPNPRHGRSTIPSTPPAPNPNPRHRRPTVPSTATPHRRSTRSANNTHVVNKFREAVAHSKTRAAMAEPTEPLLPSLNTSSAPTPSPSRYDSTSSLRDHPEDHQPGGGVAQGSRTAAATSGHEFGTVDIVAGPIEGWEMYAATATDFDGFASAAGSPEHMPSSLHDVIRQMAADDYLWEPPYRWQGRNLSILPYLIWLQHQQTCGGAFLRFSGRFFYHLGWGLNPRIRRVLDMSVSGGFLLCKQVLQEDHIHSCAVLSFAFGRALLSSSDMECYE